MTLQNAARLPCVLRGDLSGPLPPFRDRSLDQKIFSDAHGTLSGIRLKAGVEDSLDFRPTLEVGLIILTGENRLDESLVKSRSFGSIAFLPLCVVEVVSRTNAVTGSSPLRVELHPAFGTENAQRDPVAVTGRPSSCVQCSERTICKFHIQNGGITSGLIILNPPAEKSARSGLAPFLTTDDTDGHGCWEMGCLTY